MIEVKLDDMETIGVFFGSRSPEHDVSIITGQLIISGLRQMGYPVVPIYLDKQGQWYIGEELGNLKFFTAENFATELKPFGGYYLDIEAPIGKLTFKKKRFGGRTIVIDLVFPAFHGSNGEDGTIQGLLEIFNLPYIGCDVTSSALTMDKVLTKQYYQALNIPTTKFLSFTAMDWNQQARDSIKQQLDFPLFVKPARLGSSIGIAKVRSEQELDFAVQVAFHYDDKIIVEQAVERVMDITCSVIGYKTLRASLLQQSLFNADFFSYEAKYLEQGGAQLGNAQKNILIPAELDSTTTKQVQDLAIKVFRSFGCSGIARVDFLYDQTKHTCYVNEVNTLPGTLYHHLWKSSGISFQELLAELIIAAKARHEDKQKLALTFQSDILKQAGTTKLQLNKSTE